MGKDERMDKLTQIILTGLFSGAFFAGIVKLLNSYNSNRDKAWNDLHNNYEALNERLNNMQSEIDQLRKENLDLREMNLDLKHKNIMLEAQLGGNV